MKLWRWLMCLGLTAIFLNSVAAQSGENERVVIETKAGNIVIELDEKAAPETCKAFRKYVRSRVYKDSWFSRVDGNCLVGGKPGPKSREFTGSGNMACTKGPAGEFTLKHERGAIGLCRTVGSCNPTKTSNSVQFFICKEAQPSDDNEFTIFGHVVEGMDVVDKIYDGLKGQKEDSDKTPINLKIKS